MPSPPDYSRPDRPAHLKGKQIMVTREMRQAIILGREVRGLTYREIAAELGHSVDWLRSVVKGLDLPHDRAAWWRKRHLREKS
jgi:hypothetical protein